MPKIPTTPNELILPEKLKRNLYTERMLFCDQMQLSHILGFASHRALKELGILVCFVIGIAILFKRVIKMIFSLDIFYLYLALYRIWNADGTFRTAPKLFSQAYMIHVHNDFSMKPVVYAASPNKLESTYMIFLQSLIEYARIKDLILDPSSILIDFELSAFNAFKRFPPNANILFCHFHFAKNIMKRLKKAREFDSLASMVCLISIRFRDRFSFFYLKKI